MTNDELTNAIMQQLDAKDRAAVLRKHAWCVQTISTWTLLDTVTSLLRDGVYHERVTQDLTDKLTTMLNEEAA